MDEQHAKGVNDAAQRYAQATLESYRTIWDSFMEAQERQGRLAQNSLEDARSYLRTQAERNLGASEELVEQARRRQEAVQTLAKESAYSYEAFLDSLFLYYRENVSAAEMDSTTSKD